MVSINLDGEGDEFVVLNLDEDDQEYGQDEDDDGNESGYYDYEDEVSNPAHQHPNMDEADEEDDILILNATEADSPETINERRTPINVYPDPTGTDTNPTGDRRSIDEIHTSELTHILNEKPDYIKYPGGKLPTPDEKTAKNGPKYMSSIDYPLTQNEAEEYKRMYVELYDHCPQCKEDLDQEREVIGLLRHQYVHVRSQIIIDGDDGDVHKEPRILNSFSMHINTTNHVLGAMPDREDYWNNPKFYEKMTKTAKLNLKYQFPFDIFDILEISYKLQAIAIQYDDIKGKTHTIPCREPKLTSMSFDSPRHVQATKEWGGFTQYEAFAGSFTVIFKCTINVAESETLRFKPADYAFAKRIKHITKSDDEHNDAMITLGKLLLAFGVYQEDKKFPREVLQNKLPQMIHCDDDTGKSLSARDKQKAIVAYHSRNYPQISESSTCRRKSASDGNTPSKKSKKESNGKNTSRTPSKGLNTKINSKQRPKLLLKGTKKSLSDTLKKMERDAKYSDMRQQSLMAKKSTKSTGQQTVSLELTNPNGSEKLNNSTQPQFREASPYRYLSGLRINRGRLTAHSRLGPMNYTEPTTTMTGAIGGYTTYSQARPMMRSYTYLNTSNSYGNYNSNYRKRYNATPSENRVLYGRWPRPAYKDPLPNWRRDTTAYRDGSKQPSESRNAQNQK